MSYQIKFFHGKSIDELEESINKTLSGCNDEREIVSSDLIYVPEIKEFVFWINMKQSDYASFDIPFWKDT